MNRNCSPPRLIGKISSEEGQALSARLEEIGVTPSLEDMLPTSSGWDDEAARIQTFAGFLVIARRGERDPVALDIGRIMALPRGPRRLVVACREGEFPWLRDERLGRPLAGAVNYRGDWAAEWAAYGVDAREIVTAFTEGVNAYIRSLGGNLPPEYANLIQQYYINMSRGRPAAGSAPAPTPR